MKKQKSFKQRVRTRMAKTGESYTAARRMLIAAGDRPEVVQRSFKPRVSEDKIREATGRGWQDWFDRLDKWGAARRAHPEIARRLMNTHRLDNWWAQTITVGFEQARGLREPGQYADGWAAIASKTVAVPVQRLFESLSDEKLRERWLPGAEMRLRTATPYKSARYDWEDGATRVNVGFTELGESESRIALAHEKLPDSDTAEEMKSWWKERFVVLKGLLEESNTLKADTNAVRKQLRGIIRRLPEAQAVPHAEHLSLEVRKKRFGWLLVNHHGDGRLAITCRAKPKERSSLLRALPNHAHVPKYVGHHGWVGLWVDTENVDWNSVEEAVVAAYRMTAPKGLLETGGA